MRLGKFLVPLAFLLCSCASVPKESVELSVTVGRDIAEMQGAHTALVRLYYNRVISDINRFIDEVYAPFQTEKLVEEFKDELFASDGSSGEKTLNLKKISIFLEELHNEIENYRNSKLKPVMEQRDSLMKSINDSYNRIIYSNSVVTAHLASVVKVHDAQQEILSKLNLGNLTQAISTQTSALSDRIAELTKKIKLKGENVENIINEFNKLFNEEKK